MSLERRRIEQAIERHSGTLGWWPPDAIDAVLEGRKTYWTLGGPERGCEYPVTERLRQVVETARGLADAHKRRDSPIVH